MFDHFITLFEKYSIDLQINKKEKKGIIWSDILYRTIFLTFIVFGAVGGFLSSLELEYNVLLVLFFIILSAFILAFGYEQKKNFLINIASIALMLIILYIGINNFWLINSGYYAVVNKIMEALRQMHGLYDGMVYAENIKNRYMSVTMFSVFMSLIAVVLINIQVSHNLHLRKVTVLIIPIYFIIFYLKIVPSVVYLFLMLAGFLMCYFVEMTSMANPKVEVEGLGRQIGKIIKPVCIITLVVTGGFSSIINPDRFHNMKFNQVSIEKIDNFAKDLALYGAGALFNMSDSGAGLNEGRLGNVARVRPDYQTDLKITYAPYANEPLYLRGYVSMNYGDNQWEKYDDPSIFEKGNQLKELYDSKNTYIGKGRMDIEILDEAYTDKNFYPYYSEYATFDREDNNLSGTFYYRDDYDMAVKLPEVDVEEGFLTVNPSTYAAVAKACNEAKLKGDPIDIAYGICDYFQENYTYTLNPGYMFGRSDYISYFLTRSKKGFCAHFASAATMMFRYMGIPARYVEGYALSFNEMLVEGELTDKKYSDYYEGFTRLGETGVVEVEIPDAFAHAWVEIYVEGKGWICVDPTPAASGDTQSESFWDVFRLPSGSNLNLEGETEETIVTKYLGTVINYSFIVIAVIIILILMIAVVLYLIRRKKYNNLPLEEKINIRYKYLCKLLNSKNIEFGKISTINEQLNFIEKIYKNINISADFSNKLYSVFFGGNRDEEVMTDILSQLNTIITNIKKYKFK